MINESSDLLASSNAENGAHFNPLKQSQILTKSNKLPNFAQSMPNQNAYKAAKEISQDSRHTNNKPFAAYNSVGKPPQPYYKQDKHSQQHYQTDIEALADNQVTL